MSGHGRGNAELSLADLARRTGESEERLSDWLERGLIGLPDAETCAPEDIERVRFVRLCLRRGLELDAIARAERENGALTRFLTLLFPDGVSPTFSVDEAAEMAGLEPEFVQRAGSAWGLGEGDQLSVEDVDSIRALKSFLSAGFPEAALIEGTRVYADSLGRVAEMEARLFHIYVHERLRASGLSGIELLEATGRSADLARPLLEPTLLYFHRKGWERALREDMVDHVAEESGLLPPSEVPGQMRRAVVFTDLASFTPLTAAMGDAAAAHVLDRFSQIVRESVSRHDGHIVKQIGDAFFLVFPDPSVAVSSALEIESRTADEPQFPAVRSGIHWGSVLYREGDYVGSTVNIASRLASEAERHQVLVTASVRADAAGLGDVEFIRVAKRRLKGLAGAVELFEVRPRSGVEIAKFIDPVCGMELGKTEVAATLVLDDREHNFCSDACLRAYVAAPDDFATAQ